MPYSQNVTGCRKKNHGMLRNDLQADLCTYVL